MLGKILLIGSMKDYSSKVRQPKISYTCGAETLPVCIVMTMHDSRSQIKIELGLFHAETKKLGVHNGTSKN